MTHKKILFVDDEVEIGLVLKPILEAEGFEFEIVTSIQEAKELFLVDSFTDVVVDLNLPDGDGLELLAWIDAIVTGPDSSKFVEPSFFLISGCYQLIDEQKARDLGTTDIIQKPFTSSHLIDALKESSINSNLKSAA